MNECTNTSKTGYWISLVQSYQADAAQHLRAPLVNERSRGCLTNSDFTNYYFQPTRYIDNSWHWGNKTTTHIHNYPTSQSSPEEEQKKKEDAAKTIAKVVGVVFALIGAFTVGYFCSRFIGHREALKNSSEHLKSAEELGSQRCLFSYKDLTRLIGYRNRIDRDQYEKARADGIAAAGWLIGGLGTLSGAAFAIPMLVTAGYATLLAGGILFLGNQGLRLDDAERHETLRKKIVLSAENLLWQLNFCGDTITVLPTSSQNPNYVSLFSTEEVKAAFSVDELRRSGVWVV